MKYFGGYKIDTTDSFWHMLSRMEEQGKVTLNDDDIKNKSGVYVFFDWDDNPIRIGKAVKLRNRILSYATSHRNDYVFQKMEPHIQFVSVIYVDTNRKRSLVESELISKYSPKYNFTK